MVNLEPVLIVINHMSSALALMNQVSSSSVKQGRFPVCPSQVLTAGMWEPWRPTLPMVALPVSRFAAEPHCLGALCLLVSALVLGSPEGRDKVATSLASVLY